LPTLIKAKKEGQPIEDVVWDPGYSLGRPEKVAHPLRQAGIHQTFRPASHQWSPRPFSDNILVIGRAPLLRLSLQRVPQSPDAFKGSN
jgi:hypothetical protein